MEKVTFGERPEALVNQGGGLWHYHFAIEEVAVENEDGQQETRFAAHRVPLYDTLTQDKITEAVIAFLWGGGMEQKLLNDYFAYQKGLMDESAESNYFAFLEQRKAVKEQIASDCAATGIPKAR